MRRLKHWASVCADPTHPDGMEMMINGMKREGPSQADVDLMVKKNPARFLGLES